MLKKLIEAAESIAGGTRKLAALIGEKQSANVSAWKAGTRPCPEEKLIRIAEIAGRDPVETVGEVAKARARKLLARALVALVLGVVATFAHLGAGDAAATVAALFSAAVLRTMYGKLIGPRRGGHAAYHG